MTQPAQKPGKSKQDFSTPAVFIAAVKRRLKINRFAHDFAADASNAKAETYFDKARNALSVSNWESFLPGGAWGWLNPEFADIAPWAERCMETGRAGGRMLLLVPAGVGANWYRDFVHRHALVLALNGRLCFIDDWRHTIDPASVKRGTPAFYTSEPLYPKDCLLCLFGPDVVPDFDVWSWRADAPLP